MLSGHFVEINDFLLFIHPEVYPPSEDTFLIMKVLIDLPYAEGEKLALDMGCGCGILSLILAKKNYKVVGVDVNPYAIRCATINAYLNGLKSKVRFLLSDLFSNVEGVFDLIVFNPPYVPRSEHYDDSFFMRSIESRPHLILRFIEQLPSHLAEEGEAFILISDLVDYNEVNSKAKEVGLLLDIVLEDKLPWETLSVIRAIRRTC